MVAEHWGDIIGLIRNSIEIIGITAEENFPKKINGQWIEYSEVVTLFIPKNKPQIGKLIQASIKIENEYSKTISSVFGKTVILDGTKKFDFEYSSNTNSNKIYKVHLEIPFNGFIDLPSEVDNLESSNVYILDAYFNRLDSRKICSSILYLINVNYEQTISKWYH